MNYLCAILLLNIVSATFGRWKVESYCHTESYNIAKLQSKYDDYNEGDCQEFCAIALAQVWMSYDTNDHFCCGFKEYNTGTTLCELYEGQDIRDQDLTADHYAKFSAFGFGLTEVAGAALLKISPVILAVLIYI